MKAELQGTKPEIVKLRGEIPELVKQGGELAMPIEEEFTVLLQSMDQCAVELDDFDKQLDDGINKAAKFNDACEKLEDWLPQAQEQPVLKKPLSSDLDEILKQVEELKVHVPLFFFPMLPFKFCEPT